MTLSDKDWKAFNRKVREELRSGTAVVYPDEQMFLKDLRRRIAPRIVKSQQ
jgi:hypothetical protein